MAEPRGLDKGTRDALINSINELEKDQEAEKVTAEAEREALEPCEICGHAPGEKSSIKEDDKREYLRSVLGQRRFTKTYPLYDGEVEVSLRNMTLEEADEINRFFRSQRDEDQALRVERGLKLKTLYMLAKVKTSDWVEELPPFSLGEAKAEAMGAAVDKAFLTALKGKVHETLLQTISSVVLIFDSLTEQLVREGMDENFWKGAGLVAR